ncbi:MAG TPA: methyltransferase domain-containing protein [Pirellulales bacterium]|nr:methyltransferase domain-containing protein [Pirellulales bacterium]
MTSAQDNERADSALANLQAQFDIVRSEVEIAGRTLTIDRPRSADDLISDEDFDRDERLPYWADVWPSSIALAERLVGEAGAGRRLLELGAGIGLVSAIAAWRGFEVTATDYYAEALEFTRHNTFRNGERLPVTRLVDWRDFPHDLGRFDIVVASDVLYERPYADLVGAAFAATLEHDGFGILTDPQRQNGALFPEACQRHRLTITHKTGISVNHGATAQTIDLYELRF